MTSAAAIEKAVEALPQSYRGPGGAVAVVRDGEVLVRHAWGYSDLDRRVEMTPGTLMPICSISKQFTCGVLLDAFPDPAALDGDLAAWLPKLEVARPSIANLANNQSGLRDYWAMTVLHGALAQGAFTRADARSMIERTRTLHFAPGTRYSYCNVNFHILGEILQERLGDDLGTLYRRRIFDKAGMETAVLAPDTASRPGGALGYEGNAAVGFFPEVNRIWWAGDAGICASLDDMIAWERFIDATRDDENGIYRRLARPVNFADGAPARYGFGLVREQREGLVITGHGGALRGWRLQRVNVREKRLSVMVMLNHENDSHAAALGLVDAVLGLPGNPAKATVTVPGWAGDYLEPETGLVLSVSVPPGGGLSARFSVGAESLPEVDGASARNRTTTLRLEGDVVAMERADDNLSVRAVRLAGTAEATPAMAGRYRNEELDAEFEVTLAGGAPYGAFRGFLGAGAVQPLYPVAPDVWLMPVRRSMDAPAPGDWTVRFARDAAGGIETVTVGCWLARDNLFRKVPA